MSAPPSVSLQRAKGRAEAEVGAESPQQPTRLRRLHQSGCLKLRFPRSSDRWLEAVLVNTAGGLTGGDAVEQNYAVAAGAALTVTTQAAERVYRSPGGDAAARTRILVGENAVCRFLPQETILFDGGRLRRRLDVDLAATARFLLCESVILGRTLMGETVTGGFFRDTWRIRAEGRLLFAEETRLAGDIDRLAGRRATLGLDRAFATVLIRDPLAEAVLPEIRRCLDGARAGASLVGENLVAVRLVAPTGFALRKRVVAALGALANEPLPRVWSL